MKYSELCVLLGNIFVLASFFANDIVKQITLLIVGLFWLISGISIHNLERRIERLKFKIETNKFEIIHNRLNEIIFCLDKVFLKNRQKKQKR